MIKKVFVFLILIVSDLSAFEKLPSQYMVTYGDEGEKVEFIQYYSLSCPHCVAIFRNDFERMKEEYIDKGLLRYTYHPVPVDLTTVQMMCCLEKLDPNQKRLFLKVLLEELALDNPDFNLLLMKRAMELFEKPLNNLDDEEFIKASNGFMAAKEFVTQENSLNTVPSIEIGGKLIEKTPDYSFISLIMNKLFLEELDYEK